MNFFSQTMGTLSNLFNRGADRTGHANVPQPSRRGVHGAQTQGAVPEYEQQQYQANAHAYQHCCQHFNPYAMGQAAHQHFPHMPPMSPPFRQEFNSQGVPPSAMRADMVDHEHATPYHSCCGGMCMYNLQHASDRLAEEKILKSFKNSMYLSAGVSALTSVLGFGMLAAVLF